MATVTAIQQHQEAPLARPAAEWSDEQKNLIKRTVAENATDAELAMFLHVAKKSGLDPLQKQIWFVKRKQKVTKNGREEWEERVTIQAGVDGLQARALRMPDCEGIMSAAVYAKDDFAFDMKAGAVLRHEGNPFSDRGNIVGAWALVRRTGKLPFVALIRFAEYVDERSFLWKGKPAVMIEKVARSTALRRAYPEDFAGIYEPSEMGRASVDADAAAEHPEQAPRIAAHATVTAEAVTVPADPTPPAPAKAAIPPPYVSALWARAKETFRGGTAAEFAKAAAEVFGDTPKPSAEWTVEDAKAVEAILFPSDINY